MKFSLRILALAMLVAVLFSGGAFADVNEVAARIQNYGLTATLSGDKTITVTGTVAKPKTGLDMGDISGLTIKWNATLTADVADGSFQQMQANGKMRYVLVNTLANISPATFQMIGGKIILSDSNAPVDDYVGLAPARMLYAVSNIHVIVDGGELAMNLIQGNALVVTRESVRKAKATINNGIIKSDPANMTGNPVEGNPVEPVKPTPPSGGSSGGCTAAPVAGIFALLLVPFIFKKRR